LILVPEPFVPPVIPDCATVHEKVEPAGVAVKLTFAVAPEQIEDVVLLPEGLGFTVITLDTGQPEGP